MKLRKHSRKRALIIHSFSVMEDGLDAFVIEAEEMKIGFGERLVFYTNGELVGVLDGQWSRVVRGSMPNSGAGV